MTHRTGCGCAQCLGTSTYEQLAKLGGEQGPSADELAQAHRRRADARVAAVLDRAKAALGTMPIDRRFIETLVHEIEIAIRGLG